MKMIYSNENNFLVSNMKNLVEEQNIKVFIKNEFSQGAVGEISAFDAWPELWVINDTDLEQAQEIVTLSTNKNSEDWLCKYCQEANDASFEICWQCQREKS